MKLIQIFFTISFLVFMSCKEEEKPRLSNGYDYKMFVDNPGFTAEIGQVISMDYEIIDEFGNQLDNSRKVSVRPTVVIPDVKTPEMKKNPLLSLIEIMSPGDSAEVYVPIDSLDTPPQEFMQSKSITYRVKLIDIESMEEYKRRYHKEHEDKKNLMQKLGEEVLKEAEQALKFYEEGTLKGRLVNKNQGMKVMVVDEGSATKAEFGEGVDVHYYGFFKDGTSFDNSYKSGKPFRFSIGGTGAIDGFSAGITEVGQGGSAILDIPSSLAYGRSGYPPVIPPDTDLLFYIKVDKVYKHQ